MTKDVIIKISALVIAAVMLLTACSGAKTADTAATTAVNAEQAADVAVTQASAEKASSIYEITDGENTLRLSPIFGLDGKNIVAAYIISVKDKTGKDLTAQSFPMLMSVVAATGNEAAIQLTKNNGSLVRIESYSDDKGEIIAIQDVNDVNKNNKRDDFLKLEKVNGKNGAKHYKLTSEIVQIVKDGDNTAHAVVNGKKIKLTKVNSKNKAVQEKANADTAKAVQEQSTQAADNNSTTAPSKTPNSENTTNNSSGTTKPSTKPSTTSKTDNYSKIVLKKNGAAEANIDGVSTSTNEVVIAKGGDYVVTSDTTTWHGVIKIKLSNKEKADVRFENVDISYNKGSIIQIIDTSDNSTRDFLEAEVSSESATDDTLNDAMEDLADRESAPDVSLTFPTGTKSTFECSSNVYTGVIYNESKLEIKGNGKVDFTATANANNVICSSKSVTFKNVTAHLKSAAFGVTNSIGGSRGIFSYSRVNVESGSVRIDSNGDSVRCDRFLQSGGTLTATSSAADGIDTEDSIDIKGGEATVIALQKSSFKVRRLNNQERYDNGERIPIKDCVRSGKNDQFRIDGGTVKGESKKVTDPMGSSTQKVFVCRTVKNNKGDKTELKNPVSWKVGSVASSSNPCVKFLYSSNSVSNKNYDIKINNSSADSSWTWSSNYGACFVKSS
ncbi:MAG: carbohydrate-binding domain-containing protein, partial [Eubacterium sp.]|nr:carbohydrate-binding domain-containing protein [Eubacterium sp.]